METPQQAAPIIPKTPLMQQYFRARAEHSGVMERVERAWRRLVEANSPWAFEYELVLDHWRRHGRICWEDFTEAPKPTPITSTLVATPAAPVRTRRRSSEGYRYSLRFRTARVTLWSID